MKGVLVAITFCAVTIGGCEWNPARDNPLDPLSRGYEPVAPTGSFSMQVLTLRGDPIQSAEVTIEELGLFKATSLTGRVDFDRLPVDTFMVLTSYSIPGGFEYSSELSQVIIAADRRTELVVRLDALPVFLSTSAVSYAYADSELQNRPSTVIRFKAEVNDPDGVTDLDSVVVDIISEARRLDIRTKLDYLPDSSYWSGSVADSLFPNFSIDKILTVPISFRAFDKARNESAPSEPVFVWRIIHGVPSLGNIQKEPHPRLSWNYSFYYELPDTSEFFYQVIVYRQTPERPVVFSRIVTPKRVAEHQLTITETLPFGTYLWEVWVRDIFGNTSKSWRDPLNIGEGL